MHRTIALATVLAAGMAAMAYGQQGAPAPPAPNPANFTGRITPHATADIRLLRYSFEPAARTNWHSHDGGQVIIVEDGRMRTQERGGAGREFGPRETYVVAPNVVHWHGALPGAPLMQVAVSYGTTQWMAAVTDAEYAAAARKP